MNDDPSGGEGNGLDVDTRTIVIERHSSGRDTAEPTRPLMPRSGRPCRHLTSPDQPATKAIDRTTGPGTHPENPRTADSPGSLHRSMCRA